MRRKWIVLFLATLVLFFLWMKTYRVNAEEVLGGQTSTEIKDESSAKTTDESMENQITESSETPETSTLPNNNNTAADGPQTRTVSIGNSEISSSIASGTYGQDIITISYEYSIALLGLAINDKPMIIIQLPPEIANQINNDTTKQQDFLALLTGTVTYPGTSTQDIHSTTNAVSLSYSSSYSSVYVTFPTSSLVLLPGTKWSVKMSFDVGAMYKKGITVPAATNGTNYPIRGTFSDVGTGLGAISIIIGNNTKTGTINKNPLTLGTYPVPRVTPAVLTTPLQHLQTNLTGSIQQTQDSGYNYTVQLTINHTDGTATPIIINNVPVDSSGNFNAALASAIEYGDTVSTVVFARSKTNTDYIQSQPSIVQPVNWTIKPVTSISAVGNSNQLSGTAVQTAAGTYQAKLQINGGTTYSTTLNANGSFQFTGLPSFQGGESVKLWVQGISNRTGLPLLVSSDFTQAVPYLKPQLTIAQTIERKNAQGNWEAAPSTVTGQSVRFTLTVTLNNQSATWKNQILKASIPQGLTQISLATLTKKTAAGVSTPIVGSQLLTDTNTNTQYWYYQNTLAANNFTEANTSFILQYTAVITDDMADKTLIFPSSIDGSDAGGAAITTQNSSSSVPVKSGLLRFVQSPTQVSFKNIAVPSQTTTYAPSNVNASLIIADGRVAKSQWHLLVRESQAMKSTTTNKTINQAFVYRKSGQDYPITTVASEIYAYTSPDNNNVALTWNQQNGLFLKLSPSVNINVNESYTAQLQWILSDAPL